MGKLQLLSGLIFLSLSVAGQAINAPCVADAPIRINSVCADWQTTNYGLQNAFQAMEWTWVANGCGQGTIRSLLRFDLNIPLDNQQLYDNRARLFLLYPTGSTETQRFAGAATDNRFFVERITQDWDELTATWNNQPAATAMGTILVPSSIINNSTEDYIIDVSAFALDWICNGVPNQGLRLRLQTEGQTFRRVNFASREFPDPSRHPFIELQYARIDPAAPAEVCSGESFALLSNLSNAADPAGYQFTWRHEESGTTWDTPNVPDPTVVVGNNTYILTVSNPWCQTASATVNVLVKAETVTTVVFHD